MAMYYNFTNAHQQPPPTSHSHHGSRNRRAPRLSVSQNAQRQFRGVRNMKEFNESASLSTFRTKFEAVRSFELEDDIEFCPALLTESDLVSISSASERSSLASNSPQSSPTQQPQTVAPGFSLNSSSPPFVPPTSYQSQQSNLKLHQPAATRGRNAIPIVNPATGISMSSPPSSVSPAKLQQSLRRW
ncbi:hypothetical protein ACRE_007910 [Hapsidospora chrysogenum ATCC 11550]|uniref:Uncharacterized protein n=1 Tax=Hapsidospora chrysogenum (strain ATCC 11550 / CBS 779.69 / DSM 880 / IAM 14645 / JCM 23072 / IMI 49137) TaxID=857340 RepID=A0A086TG54_HAPC1|nr:hypothetical protein ACRE_007910 [Hapsidospora chrysogenum ATCC 11550]